MKDFKLDMNVYDYKNEKQEVYGKFSKLKREQLCFIQDLSISHCFDEDKYVFRWKYQDETLAAEIDMEDATVNDIEEVIKECFDYYKIKYDYVKVELL